MSQHDETLKRYLRSWSTNPETYCAMAKAKARECINQKAPRLTALERAFWQAAREGR